MKIQTNTTAALKPNFISSLLLCAVLLKICIFFNLKTKSSKQLYRKDSHLVSLILKVVFITVNHVKVVQDDIFVKNCSQPIVSH